MIEREPAPNRVVDTTTAPSQPAAAEPRPAGPPPASRTQRLLLLGGVALLAWVVLALFASILLPFVVAAGIAYFLHPLASRLARLGVPRGMAAGLLVLALIAAALVFMFLLYPLIVQQVWLLIDRVPAYASHLRLWAGEVFLHLQQRLGRDAVNDRLRDLVTAQLGNALSFLAGALTRIVGGGFALFNVLSLMVVAPVVAFYLLRDWPRLVARLDAWMPRRYSATLSAQAREVDRILSAWLRGQAIYCVVLALFYAVALSAAGLDLGLIVGLFTGVLSFIPYVGAVTGGLVSLGLAMAQFPDWQGVIRVGLVFVLGQCLEWLIYPRLLGGRVQLHAVWVIFALFAGGAAFGFLGVLLAVPVAAAIGVVARFWLARYLASPLYRDPAP